MKSLTQKILGVLILALLVYDVIAIQKGGTEASISSVLISFSYKMPIFTFLAGIVCGHLFWRMRTNNDTKNIDKG
jgi:hypothetical protein